MQRRKEEQKEVRMEPRFHPRCVCPQRHAASQPITCTQEPVVLKRPTTLDWRRYFAQTLHPIPRKFEDARKGFALNLTFSRRKVLGQISSSPCLNATSVQQKCISLTCFSLFFFLIGQRKGIDELVEIVRYKWRKWPHLPPKVCYYEAQIRSKYPQ